MIKNFLWRIKFWLRRHTIIKEVLTLLLLIGIVYFAVKGALILGLGTVSPMVGVSGTSMTHSDNMWRIYYENNAEGFPFQDGVHPGDLVLVEGIDSMEDLKMGDVVVWVDGNTRIIHRVALKKENYLRTRGDNNEYLDDKISVDRVIGKAVFSVSYLGYPSLWGVG